MQVIAVAKLEKRSEPCADKRFPEKFVVVADRASLPEEAIVTLRTCVALLPAFVVEKGVYG